MSLSLDYFSNLSALWFDIDIDTRCMFVIILKWIYLILDIDYDDVGEGDRDDDDYDDAVDDDGNDDIGGDDGDPNSFHW